MNPFEMVVMIVGIVMIASVIKSRHRARHGIVADKEGNEQFAGPTQDTVRMESEIKDLKERISVLERVITETNGAVALDREIEKLR